MRLIGKVFLLAGLLSAPALAQEAAPPIPAGTDPRYVSRDTVDFDEVGYAAVGGGEGVSATHPSLPVPSFVEITALDSGRTILVRVTANSTPKTLIEMSPAAAEQLGVGGSRIAVRIRRTNPPAHERTALTSGGRVAERLETPPALLNALRKKLENASPGPVVAVVDVPPNTKSKPKPTVADKKVAAPPPAAATGSYFVQIAALSNEARARALAKSIGGSVQAARNVWRVRAGPYASDAAARTALGGLKTKGYRDARITR